MRADRYRWSDVVLRIAVGATLSTAAAAALSGPMPGSYRLQDISGNGQFQYPTAINNAGAVTGFSQDAVGGGYYFSAQTGLLGIDVPTLPGSSELPVPRSAYGVDINASGEVTGTWGLGTDMRSFRYTPATGSRDLGGVSHDARSITDSGRVVGTVFRENNRLDIFLSEPGATATATQVPPVPLSNVVGVRDDGVIVANRLHEEGGWRTVAGTLDNGVWQDLPRTGQLDTTALGFNDRGVVVGAFHMRDPQSQQSQQSQQSVQHAFAFDEVRGWIDIAAAMSGIIDDSVASAVNEGGLVVGYGMRRFEGDNFSFIHDLSTGSGIDMNEAVAPGTWAGWTQVHFTDVNDVGQIVGVGIFDSQPRAFLLSLAAPVPEPASLGLMLMGLAVMAFTARQRRRDRHGCPQRHQR